MTTTEPMTAPRAPATPADAPRPTAAPAGRRVLVVTPARDEELRIGDTIASMAAQTVLPVLWVIVDDGSKDGTARVAREAAAKHPWIRVVQRPDRGRRALGSGVIEAFYEGLASATGVSCDYVAKVDADITFGPAYLETMLRKFEADARLGIASGKVYRPESGGAVEEFMIDDHVTGAWKLYRAACFRSIGGLVPAVMWDGIDFHRARQTGWRTRSFHDSHARILHHRLMGSSDRNVHVGRVRWGRGQWYMGSHPLYILGSAVLRMREKPRVTGGLLILWGYVSGWMKGLPRFDDAAFRREMRAWQLARLGRVFRGEVR